MSPRLQRATIGKVWAEPPPLEVACVPSDELLAMVGDIVCCFDGRCRHLYASPNITSLGMGEPHALRGASHRELGLPEPLPSIWEALIRRVAASGEPSSCDIAAARSPDERWVSWRFVRLRGRGLGDAIVVALGREVTREVRLERRLREATGRLEQVVVQRTGDLFEARRQLHAAVAQRERLEALARERQHEIERIVRANLLAGLASGLAHELNQPLSAAQFGLSGCLRMFQEGGLSHADGIEALGAALVQVRRAGEIVRHVMELTRRHVPKQRAASVEIVLEQAAALLRLEALSRGNEGLPVSIETQVSGPLPALHVDPVQIEQVVINLGRNAIDALRSSAAGGVVTLAARSTTTAVEVSVSDDGPGFAPDALARQFQPFFTTKPDGVGLGMAICRGIVEEHGGRMVAENNPRVGARVRFTLPLHAPHT